MKTEGGYLIGRAKFLSGRKLNKLFSEYGLTEFNGEQGKILYYLWKNLIYRKQSTKDKRKKNVFLTDKGKFLESKSKIVTDKMDEIFYKGFSESEIEMFENMLRKIIVNMEDGYDK